MRYLVRPAVVAAAVIGLTATCGGVTQAGAAPTETSVVGLSADTIGPVTVNCGIVTCSAYLSRSATRSVHDATDGIDTPNVDIPSVACEKLAELTAEAAPVTFVACMANAMWVLEELKRAAEDHGDRGACLKVTFTKTRPPAVTYWSTNNGQYCKD
jgi:hypothetical protein